MLFIKKLLFACTILIWSQILVSPHFLHAMNELDVPAQDDLMEAIRTGSLQHLAAILALPIDLNVPRYDANTNRKMYPLEAAIDFQGTFGRSVMSGRTTRLDEAVRLLLGKGANPNVGSARDMMPLDRALKQLYDIKNNPEPELVSGLNKAKCDCLLGIIKNLCLSKAVSREPELHHCLSQEELDAIGVESIDFFDLIEDFVVGKEGAPAESAESKDDNGVPSVVADQKSRCATQ